MTEFTNEGFNAGYKAGILVERERIIALLEAERDAMRSSRTPIDWEQSYGIDIAIALIKGENE